MKKKDTYTATEASFDTLMALQSGSQDIIQINTENDSAHNFDVNNKGESSQSKLESDRDSDYEGSDFGSKKEVTTLRMLFEKCRSSDYEFYNCCLDVGLLNPSNDKCTKCNSLCPLVEAQSSIDNLVRRCPNCSVEWSIRRDSWIDGINANLKELSLAIYCWCRDYSHSLATHEIDVDPNAVASIFSKCAKVADIYFQNPLSNIGGTNKTILTDIFNYNDRTIIGLLDQVTKNVFYKILMNDYDDSLIVTVLIDNLIEGTTILTKKNSRVSQILDDECTAYLKESWDINIKIEEETSTESLISHWTEFESQLPSCHSLYPNFSELDPELILRQALFRKRMDNSKDSFLYFIAVTSDLFSSSYS